jgi:hypothetical protein
VAAAGVLRHPCRHNGALSGLGLDIQPASKQAQTLLHAGEPEAATLHGGIEVEPLAPIRNPEAHELAIHEKVNAGIAARGMFPYVAERFLGDAIEAGADFVGYFARQLTGREIGFDARLVTEFSARPLREATSPRCSSVAGCSS